MSDEVQTSLQRFIARVLKAAPQTRDWYDARIRERSGKTGKPIWDIERGKSKRPSRETLKLVAAALDQPLSLLERAMDGEDIEPVIRAHGPERSTRIDLAPDKPQVVTSSDDDPSVEIVQLDLSYAMGPGTDAEDFPEETRVRFDPNFIRSLTRTPYERLYVASGEGDSMFPTIINNDQLLIDTNQRTLNMQDKIWAISVHGASMVKRLRAAGEGKVRILSDNERVPPDEVSVEDLFIFGRVIWAGRRM